MKSVHMMRHLHFLTIALILFLFIPVLSHAQSPGFGSQRAPSFSNPWRFGGGLSLNFGNEQFGANITPSVLYQFNPYVGVGVNGNFSYFSRRDFFKSTVVGGGLFSLFTPIPAFQLSAEYEQLYVNQRFDDRINEGDRAYWYPALFLGAGYTSGPVTFGVRYDVLYEADRSIYANAWMPFVRVFF